MKWLNLVEKVVLIKSILASFLIYISAMFIAPKYVINNISIELKKIICQGAKNKSKKIHMVNWATIKEDKAKGALGLRYLGLLNKALGAKIVGD